METEMAEKKETVKYPVTMKDGRVLEFTERQKCKTERLEGGSLRFDFKSGDSVTVEKADVIALQEQFMWHGVEQKYRDEFASAQDAEDAFEWVLALHERVKRGEWREARESTGGVSGAGLLVRALCELHSLTPEKARAFLADKSPKEQAILRDYGPIRAKIEEIKGRSPKADTSAQASALLAGLPSGA
jgi:hypothetical protein